MKVLYIPLDERPCNYKYPSLLVEGCKDIELVIPPIDMLNHKKTPGDIEKIWAFVEEQVSQCNYAIISINMLVYGGLLPSRLHKENEEILLKRVERIRNLKKINENIKLYCFDLIMRVPAYDSAEEEPDYYGEFGEVIFNISWLKDKIERGASTEEDIVKYNDYLERLPKEYYDDYFNRRGKNCIVTNTILDMVYDSTIDFLVIPQDDSSLYGVQSQEQGKHKATIKEKNITNKVLMYPGADEVGCTLLSKIINEVKGKMPKVYVRFSSVLGPTIIPKYEDRPFIETIKAHIISSGMLVTDNSVSADIILMVNTPGVEMKESWEQREDIRTNFSYRNLNEFVLATKAYCEEGKKVVIADVSYSNGADLELIRLLGLENVLDKIHGYAGWNTNGNTLGTTLAAATIGNYYPINRKFIAYRLIEDAGYQAEVRQKVIAELPKKNLSYYDFKEEGKWVEDRTKELLNEFLMNNLNNYTKCNIIINKVSFPWERMFEIDLELEVE